MANVPNESGMTDSCGVVLNSLILTHPACKPHPLLPSHTVLFRHDSQDTIENISYVNIRQSMCRRITLEMYCPAVATANMQFLTAQLERLIHHPVLALNLKWWNSHSPVVIIIIIIFFNGKSQTGKKIISHKSIVKFICPKPI